MTRFALATMAVVAAGLAAAAAGQEQQADVQVVGLEVFSPTSTDAGKAEVFGHSPGTSVYLKVRSPGPHFVEVDKKASELLQFADDKGTDLSRKGRGMSFGPRWLGLSTRVSKDGRACVLEVTSDWTPKPAAREVRIKAGIAIVCGSGEKTTGRQAVTLKPGTKFSAGPLAMTVKSVRDGGWGDVKLTVSLTSKQNLARIKSVEFSGADGQKTPHKMTGSGRSGFENDMTYSRDYGLHKKVDAVSLRVTYFQKMATTVVPIDITTGIGVGAASAAKPSDIESPKERSSAPEQQGRPSPGRSVVLFQDDFDGRGPQAPGGAAGWSGPTGSTPGWRVKDGKLLGAGGGEDWIQRSLLFSRPPAGNVEVLADLSFTGPVRDFAFSALYHVGKKAYHYHLWYLRHTRPNWLILRLSTEKADRVIREDRRVRTKLAAVGRGEKCAFKLARVGNKLIGTLGDRGSVTMDLAGVSGGARLTAVTVEAICGGGSVMLDSLRVACPRRSAAGLAAQQTDQQKPPTAIAKEAPGAAPKEPDLEKAAESKLSLANLYVRHGLRDKAIALYRSIIKEFPQTPAADTAGKELQKLAAAAP